MPQSARSNAEIGEYWKQHDFSHVWGKTRKVNQGTEVKAGQAETDRKRRVMNYNGSGHTLIENQKQSISHLRKLET